MQLAQKLMLVPGRLGHRYVAGLLLVRMKQTVVGYDCLGPDAAYVVAAARYYRV